MIQSDEEVKNTLNVSNFYKNSNIEKKQWGNNRNGYLV